MRILDDILNIYLSVNMLQRLLEVSGLVISVENKLGTRRGLVNMKLVFISGVANESISSTDGGKAREEGL